MIDDDSVAQDSEQGRRRVKAEKQTALKKKERREYWDQLSRIFAEIESPIPCDADNPIDDAKLDEWLVEYNNRIEKLVSYLKQTELGEFLPFTQWRDDAERFCAKLLRQDGIKRLESLRIIAKDLQEGDFHHWFDSFQLDGFIHRDLHRFLLAWRNWLRAESWAERYRIYQHNFEVAQRATALVNNPVDANAFNHCEEQHRRLMTDPERIEAWCPIPRPWVNDGIAWQPADVSENEKPEDTPMLESTTAFHGVQPPEANAGASEAKAALEIKLVKLLDVFTNNQASDRFNKVVDALSDDKLSNNDKLEAIDKLIKIPATASAAQLGNLLGISRQAVAKLDWWLRNRKGKQAEAINIRESKYKQRAELQEFNEVEDCD